MNIDKDPTQDLAEIRSIMERSTKFLFLSGLAGIFAGLFAILGTYYAIKKLEFIPDQPLYDYTAGDPFQLILLGSVILILSLGTAFLFSYRKASKVDKKLWNTSTRRLLGHISVPLLTGGVLILIFFSQTMYGLMAPLTLIFYGLALFIAGRFSFDELKAMGIVQILLGLLSLLFIPFSMILWGIGFGLMHIIYGIYVYQKYERFPS